MDLSNRDVLIHQVSNDLYQLAFYEDLKEEPVVTIKAQKSPSASTTSEPDSASKKKKKAGRLGTIAKGVLTAAVILAAASGVTPGQLGLPAPPVQGALPAPPGAGSPGASGALAALPLPTATQYQGALAEISSLKDSNPQGFETLMVTYPALQAALNNEAPILTVTPQVTTSSELSQAVDDPLNYTPGQGAGGTFQGTPMVALDGFTPRNTTSELTVYEGLADDMSKALVGSVGAAVVGAAAAVSSTMGDQVQIVSDTVAPAKVSPGLEIVQGDDLTLPAPSSAPTRYIPANLRNLPSLQDALDKKSYKTVMDMNESIRRTLRENDNAVKSEAKTIPEQMQQYTILRQAVPNDRTKKLYNIFRVKAIQRLDAIKEKMDDVGIDIEVVQNFLTDVDNGEATNVLEELSKDREAMASRAVNLKTIVSDNRVDLSAFTTLEGGDDDTREGRIRHYAAAVASRVNLTGDVTQKQKRLQEFKTKVREQFESDFRFNIPGFKEKYDYSGIRLQFEEALSEALL